MPASIKTYITTRVCANANVSTQVVGNKPDIPEGRPVCFNTLWRDSDTVYARVHWQGRTYDINPDALSVRIRDINRYDSPKPGLMARRKGDDIKILGQIPLWNEQLEPIASQCWLAIDSHNALVQIYESECEYFYMIGPEREVPLEWNPSDISDKEPKF